MALTNAEKQKLHRQRQKEKLESVSSVMTVMEKWMEENSTRLRNRALADIEKGRDIRFIKRTNYHFCYYSIDGYVTAQIDGTVFMYMALKGYICFEGVNRGGIGEDLYRIAPDTNNESKA